MIKIIENPKPVTCSNCGCKFTFEASDVKLDKYIDEGAFLGILPLTKMCKSVRCPICNTPRIIKYY